ncbi:hypothetical protein [Xylanimonas protaetiae]|uniref:Uncharacterized protein n=1 Tax=Xylanimonas protaetiae TaxID=2509457 RepID=A0A4P6FBD3_9MICO|nr:hypothetical protein [Xylanimonas protaetiae]QAY71609.1 hypothetical protein ET471_17520 [Xylanimonas protaetiae]
MLGYRSLFTVARDSIHGCDVDALIGSQVHAWLRSKGLDADAVEPGTVVDVGRGAEAALSVEDAASGSRSSRFHLTEASGWTSQVIVHDPRDGRHDPWVWIDVNSPDEQTVARAPKLARMVLSVVEARDGGAVLDPAVRTLRTEDVPTLVSALRDTSRRGPVFVAGSSDEIPMEPWRALISKLLRDTTGLAAGFLLDPAATEEFARRVGASHAVAPGTLRTFVREVDLDDALDGRRHRVLTTERIARDREVHLLRILGRVARDHTLTYPIPTAAARVEGRLIRQADEDFLRSARTPTTAVVDERVPALALPERGSAPEQDELDLDVPQGERDEQGTFDIGVAMPPATPKTSRSPWPSRKPKLAGPVPHQATLHESATDAPEPVAVDGGVLTRIMAALRRLLGSDGVTPEAIEDLGARAAEAAPLRELVKRKEASEQVLQDEIGTLRQRHADAVRQREDVTLDFAEAGERARRLEAELAALRRALQESGNPDLGELAWTDHLATDDAETLTPDSFEELLLAWSTAQESGSLGGVVWTGDRDTVLALDEHGPASSWAGVTWTVLRALDDYARVSAAGEFNGSVDDYLRNTPPGCHGYSANRHAQTESETVRNNDRYANSRYLPVPRSIDPSGRKHLWAHFKIAQYAMVAPRLHYLDATATDGKIYVGYIGKHLPLPSTN